MVPSIIASFKTPPTRLSQGLQSFAAGFGCKLRLRGSQALFVGFASAKGGWSCSSIEGKSPPSTDTSDSSALSDRVVP
eukprot:4406953-Amphidinium_carterae.1